MPHAWTIFPKIDNDFINANTEYDKIILQLLFNRGFKTKTAREQFLSLDYEAGLADPFLFKDMESAVRLIIERIKQGSNIVVYGDFDTDGVTASAVLVETLSTLKAKAAVYIPDRTSEGYGLNKKAIDELAKRGNKLIITVDNGIRNKAEARYAKELGLDIVITDHHEAPALTADLPDCLVINPVLEKNMPVILAGVGVAFKLAKALIIKANLDETLKRRLERKILDLVAVGTVADCVSLTGENRILVSEGLKILNQNKRLGLAELKKIAKLNGGEKPLSAWNISWQIAPRLNSAGRLDHANTAYELLITKDESEAKRIAEKLNQTNAERQKITEDISAHCQKIIESQMMADKILILCSPGALLEDKAEGGAAERERQGKDWPEGVIGLVAGRLCEQYAKPALVITKSNGEIKGSGRSIDEFHVTLAIEQAKEYLLRFGGHAAACGFTVKSRKDLTDFTEKLKVIAKTALAKVDLTPKLLIDAELDLSEIHHELINELNKFEPFGEDNPRPKFISFNIQIKDKVVMGDNAQHVKFRFNGFWAVSFGQAENFKDLKIGDRVDAVYYLEFNEFNGNRSVQMKIVDIKSHNA